MKKCALSALLCLTCCMLHAQNLSGFWKGTFNMNRSCFPVNNIELQITITANGVFGKSYHYLDVNNYVLKNFVGFYQSDSKKIILQEEDVTIYRIPNECKVCVKKFELVYSRDGNLEVLSGGWSGNFVNSSIDCETGPIILSRIPQSAFKEVPEIKVDTGEIRLDFFDNGEIDGDSITVLINKKVVLSHQKLGAKPLTAYVKIDPEHSYQEVEMIAENLGSIPPNTALLIITAGTKQYELFLTSTETKSALVRFRYEKPVARGMLP